MKINRSARLLAVLTAVLALAWLPSRAQAQFQFTLTSDTASGTPGGSVTYFGTLTNGGASALTLSSAFYNAATGPFGADLTSAVSFADPSFYDAPFTLAPSQVYTGPLFTLSVDSGAPLGLYTGNFSIAYSGLNAGPAVGRDINTNVGPTAVPEAGTGVGLAFGLIVLAAVLLRRPRAARP